MRTFIKSSFTAALFAILPAITLPAMTHAQDALLAQYVADIGPQDHYNSGGQRLATFAAILAQDRANFHRFGIRHPSDGADPIFSDRAMRAQITPAVMQIPDYYDQYITNILHSSGEGGTYFVVYVHGTPGNITRITMVVPG